MDTSFPFAEWFRSSSPYINAHRGRTFVILVEGQALEARRRESLIQDVTLLHILGVRVVLVFGIRPQVDQALARAGHQPPVSDMPRVVDDATMHIIEREAMHMRLGLEAQLSLGLPNTPMYGADITAVSGNIVMARPFGIRDGIDYLHEGEVRRVRAEAITSLLDQRHIVVLPPIGYSSTGEVFDVSASAIALHAATALKADKLILIGDSSGFTDPSSGLLRQLTPADAERFMAQSDALPGELRRHLGVACEAARQGVARTHLISWRDHDALLGELFTRDGVGTMITRDRYEQLRDAELRDVGGLLALLKPLEEQGVLVARSRERLEHDMGDYLVIERDGMIIGCAALHVDHGTDMAELACVVVHGSYRGGERGDVLLQAIEQRARRQGIRELYALTTHTAHWFFERGFETVPVERLPEARRQRYNPTRNSRVLIKPL
ncbi:amino-acid N-acetyltransferase [Larsenimonas rhizosphaerae]|uniref:amino-acid N-acetyltransferase n=1 Tax=Larsenimonas rhizosphaerae TaxID=2944682 RepID=UPI0020347AD4|nr:amino-acid N-acetyltransferase [Larsenimonas rhizosphaerae]MCM2130028.1 amino-acid N-acetyltransferase [Larsenimonas rhizosphaerae]